MRRDNMGSNLLLDAARSAHDKLVSREAEERKQIRRECCYYFMVPGLLCIASMLGIAWIIYSGIHLVTAVMLGCFSFLFIFIAYHATVAIILPARRLIQKSRMRVAFSSQIRGNLRNTQKATEEKCSNDTTH